MSRLRSQIVPRPANRAVPALPGQSSPLPDTPWKALPRHACSTQTIRATAYRTFHACIDLLDHTSALHSPPRLQRLTLPRQSVTSQNVACNACWSISRRAIHAVQRPACADPPRKTGTVRASPALTNHTSARLSLPKPAFPRLPRQNWPRRSTPERAPSCPAPSVPAMPYCVTPAAPCLTTWSSSDRATPAESLRVSPHRAN